MGRKVPAALPTQGTAGKVGAPLREQARVHARVGACSWVHAPQAAAS